MNKMKKFRIDPMHSDIAFKVKHMMISTVNGCFQSFDADMECEKEDFSDAVVNFECDVDSISTNIGDRDSHLKSDDFFSAHIYPKIKFTSNQLSITDGNLTIKGDLTIRDNTKSVELKGKYNGSDTDMYGSIKHGFELEGTISRSDFGLSFNMFSGKGNALVSDEIRILISIQMVEEK